jgi:hypothetical protein
MKSMNFLPAGLTSFLIFSLCCIISGCSERNQEGELKNDLAAHNLRGEVKSLTEILRTVEIRAGEIKRGEMSHMETYKFNSKGNIVESRLFGRDGSLKGSSTYKYDDNGRLIEKTELEYSGRLEYNEKYTYDKNGFLTEKNTFRPPDNQWNIGVYYDEKGNLRKESYHRLVKSEKMKFTYTNDLKGNRIEERSSGEDGSQFWRRLNKFDDKGNIIETSLFNSNDSLLYNEYYKYDENGNIIQYNQDNSIPEMKQMRRYKYDEHGDIIEITYSYGQDSSIEKYIYEKFDKTGNWHKKSYDYSSEKGAFNHSIITERKIEYY